MNQNVSKFDFQIEPGEGKSTYIQLAPETYGEVKVTVIAAFEDDSFNRLNIDQIEKVVNVLVRVVTFTISY